MAAAINTAVTDLELRARATAVGAAIRAEDGVTRAIELIEVHAGQAR